MPLYPGSGAQHETGAHGNILNCPLPPGAGSAEFRRVVELEVLPAVEAMQPQFILISAGFDAHRADPLANLMLTEDDFAGSRERFAIWPTRIAGAASSRLWKADMIWRRWPHPRQPM